MALPVIVLGIAGAIAAAPVVIDGIKRALDALGFDRSCIIEVINTTAERMQLVRSGHSSGTYERPPDPVLEPYSTMVFSSRSTAAGRGAVGNIGWLGDGLDLSIDYSNPFAGSNDLDATFRGARAGEFRTLAENGAGHTNARFRCIIYAANNPDVELVPSFFKTLKAVNVPDHYVRHSNFRALLESGGDSDDFKFDLVIRSRTPDGQPDIVGVRSVNYPDRYLRHRNSEVWLDAPAGEADLLWAQDSSFHWEVGVDDGWFLRSVNYPDRYLRHRDFKMYVEAVPPEARADASFRRWI